jgi:hypothetical protein
VSPILKLDPEAATEEQELEFELAYQRGLTTAERFEMMFRRSREAAEILIRRGHRKPIEISKRE